MKMMSFTMSTEDNTQVVFEPARELLMELSPIMELFHGSHDMTAQLVKESNIEGRSHSRDYWMTILECIKSTLETSAASKLVLLEELSACLKAKNQPNLKILQKVHLLFGLVSIHDNTLQSLSPNTILTPGVLLVADADSTRYFNIPTAKKDFKDCFPTVRSILGFFFSMNVTDVETAVKTLYDLKDGLGAVKDKVSQSKTTMFEFQFHTSRDPGEASDEIKCREQYFASLETPSVEKTDVYLTMTKSVGKEKVFDFTCKVDGVLEAQKNFLLMLGCRKRKQRSQVVASPVVEKSGATYAAIMDSILEMTNTNLLSKEISNLEKTRKKKNEEEEEEEEEVQINLGSRLAQIHASLSKCVEDKQFVFHTGKTEGSTVHAREMNSACKLNKALSTDGYFASVAPKFESIMIQTAIDIVTGSEKSYFENKYRYSKYLFENFNVVEDSGINLQFNKTQRFTSGIFHVSTTHASIFTPDGESHSLKSAASKVGSMNFEDHCTLESNGQRILKIKKFGAKRFSFPLDVKVLLATDKNSSRFIDSKAFFTTAGDIEFKKLDDDSYKMHIPLTRHIRHLPLDEPQVHPLNDGMDIDEGKNEDSEGIDSDGEEDFASDPEENVASDAEENVAIDPEELARRKDKLARRRCGREKRKRKKERMIEFVRKNFGNKMHPFSQYEWQPGDPEGLRNFDHLGDAVFFGRYEGADTIDPEFANLTSGMIVNDPGGRFIGVSYVVGSRMVIVHAPHLSGEMSVEKKLVKKWQREMDKLINHASEGKYEYDLAMHCWRIASEEHELERYRAMKTAEKTYHQSRRDCSTPEIDKLKERISKSTSRMLKSRNRAHQAISDFVTAFSHIVWPSFGKDQKMFKKKVGALPG
ncbi:MAG: hypothetical protein SGCHY_005463 [Lobulomycetales sp.]